MDKRLSKLTIDGINMLKMRGDGETDVQTIMKKALIESGKHKRQVKWAYKAGISKCTLSRYAHNPELGMTLYNAENLLKAAGLRLTIEVDE